MREWTQFNLKTAIADFSWSERLMPPNPEAQHLSEEVNSMCRIQEQFI